MLGHNGLRNVGKKGVDFFREANYKKQCTTCTGIGAIYKTRQIRRFTPSTFADMSVIDLFFPPLCAACKNVLVQGETVLCLGCESRLPHAHMLGWPDSPLEKTFWGRVPVAAAGTLFIYGPQGPVHDALHALKYRKYANVGRWFGTALGRELSTFWDGPFAVVPVPIHPRKRRERGFNQAELIAEGIAATTGWPVEKNLLRSVRRKATQTKLGRLQRWNNVSGSIALHPKATCPQVPVLLIDDVITTGATIAACWKALAPLGMSELWVASVACRSV